jgi:hypothetical protein
MNRAPRFLTTARGRLFRWRRAESAGLFHRGGSCRTESKPPVKAPSDTESQLESRILGYVRQGAVSLDDEVPRAMIQLSLFGLKTGQAQRMVLWMVLS